jgi:peptidoglycan/xylan/chitin deacetylase (PgdA/CDA1 family)/LysM repeat protein
MVNGRIVIKKFRKHVGMLLTCILLLGLVAVCSVTSVEAADTNKVIALTFDDGPSEYTERILDILNENNAQATFCVVGSKIADNQQVLTKALSQGCEIIGHTWNHRDLTTLAYVDIEQELRETNRVLFETLNINPKMFRPSFGELNDDVINVAKEMDYSIILWSISTLDWETQDAIATYESIMTNVHNGAIILCHDTVKSTMDAMERVIPELISKGYTLVTVSTLLGETAAGQIYRNTLNGWTGCTHVVQSGESLWSISKLYSTTIDAIKTLNDLTGDIVLPGMLLAIPDGTPIIAPTIPPDFTGTIYTVQSGDSLSSISKKFDTTIDAIKTLNSLTSDTLKVGWLLAIPDGTPIITPDPDPVDVDIIDLFCSYSSLVKVGNGNDGYGETTVTLTFELSDGTTVVKEESVSNIKWGVTMVQFFSYNIADNDVTVTITIVSTGNNFNQLAISNVFATYTVAGAIV